MRIWTVLLLLLTAPLLFSQERRGIDFTQTLDGLDGKPLMNGDAAHAAPVTLGDVAVTALSSTFEADRNDSPEVKFQRYELARKVYKNKNAVLTVEEIATIKTRIGQAYGPIVIGAAWHILDPALK